MDLPINTFKRGLKVRKPQIGLWCSLSTHYAIGIVAGSGFDWLLLDTEHSPNDLESVLKQLQVPARYSGEDVPDPLSMCPWLREKPPNQEVANFALF